MEKNGIMVFAILVVIIAGLTSFILYDKFVSNVSNKDKSSGNENSVLSTDDEVVQKLYNYIKTDIYEDERFNFKSKTNIIYAASLGAAEKSYLAYRIANITRVYCKDSDPGMSVSSFGYDYSACDDHEFHGITSEDYYAGYKKIFGEDGGYPTSMIFCNTRLEYNPDYEMYILYSSEGGCGATIEPIQKLISAKKIDGKIELIENITDYDENKITSTIDYKYTFKKDKDGNYIYYSVETLKN